MATTTPRPRALALRSLARQVQRRPSAKTRAALRAALQAGSPQDGLAFLPGAAHCLRMAESSVGGVDPEAALFYLAMAVDSLERLQGELTEVQAWLVRRRPSRGSIAGCQKTSRGGAPGARRGAA